MTTEHRQANWGRYMFVVPTHLRAVLKLIPTTVTYSTSIAVFVSVADPCMCSVVAATVLFGR